MHLVFHWATMQALVHDRVLTVECRLLNKLPDTSTDVYFVPQNEIFADTNTSLMVKPWFVYCEKPDNSTVDKDTNDDMTRTLNTILVICTLVLFAIGKFYDDAQDVVCGYDASCAVVAQLVASVSNDAKYTAREIVKQYASIIFALEHYGKTDLHPMTTSFLTPTWDALRQMEAAPNGANVLFINTLFEKDKHTSLQHLQVAVQLCKLLDDAQRQTTCNVQNCACK